MTLTLYKNGLLESLVVDTSGVRVEEAIGDAVVAYRVLFNADGGYLSARILVGGVVVCHDIVEWELPE